jgi:hypothetical protein
MTPWLNQFMHDAAGGILGGMGGTVFGPAGVVVGTFVVHILHLVP